jgi:osmotically-inducible protein OsmY
MEYFMRVPLRIVPRVAAVAAFSLAATGAFAQTSPPVQAPAKSPDNTEINTRDRAGTAPTPTDQRNDSADIKVAAAVRRSISKDKSLSMTARNIKLVANGGEVTLRGPVKSEEEKARIEQIARATAGVSVVDNELDVAQ